MGSTLSTTLTDRFASALAAFDYDTLPSDVTAYLKWLLVDSLACSIGGSTLQAGQIAREVMAEPAARDSGILAATGERLSLRSAVYLNSYFASVMDFDDFYIVHPGVCAGPPMLAVADSVGATGRQFIAALALAYEVQLRVARAIQPTPARARLAAGTSTPQIFGPTAGTGHLLGLTARQMVSALGLAAANAPVPHKTNRSIGGNPRPLSWVQGNVGWISMGGVLAAQMAAKGFQGRQEILDGEMGFWAMAGSDRFQPEWLLDGFGSRYELLSVAFKPFSCCRWIHSPAEALQSLVEQYDLRPDQVHRVIVRSYPILDSFMDPAPANFVDGQFSLPYNLALILCRRPTGYGWLHDQHRTDRIILEQAKKVQFELDPSAAQAFLHREYPAEVTVVTDGGTLTARVEIPLGDPRRPVSTEHLQAKYRALVDPVLGPQRSRNLFGLIMRLEEVDDVRQALTEVYRT